MTIPEQVISILAAQALRDPAELSPAMGIADLGLDSLGLVEAIFALEERFDIAIPFNPNEEGASDQGFDLSDIGSIIRGVEALLAAKVSA